MFWDTSAIIPVLLPEPRSARSPRRWRPIARSPCGGALPSSACRPSTAGTATRPVPGPLLTAALNRLRVLVEDADAVSPTDEVRRRAGRLVAAHPLRTADALQLGAALVWCEEPAPARRSCASTIGFARPRAARASHWCRNKRGPDAAPLRRSASGPRVRMSLLRQALAHPRHELRRAEAGVGQRRHHVAGLGEDSGRRSSPARPRRGQRCALLLHGVPEPVGVFPRPPASTLPVVSRSV